MKESVKEIIRISEMLDVSISDGVFIAGLIYGTVSVPITKESLISLVDRGIIVGSKVDRDIVKALDTSKRPKRSNVIHIPTLCEASADIMVRMMEAVCPNGVPEEDFLKYKKFTDNDVIIPFVHLFFSLFPSNNPKRNGDWVAHFGTPWTGNTLRVVTKGTMRKLESAFKSKDAGMFLYATYTAVKESYSTSGERYFVKNTTNYLKESAHWYELVCEQLKDGKLDNLLSGKTKSKSNMFII